jgi:hypothetical protein
MQQYELGTSLLLGIYWRMALIWRRWLSNLLPNRNPWLSDFPMNPDVIALFLLFLVHYHDQCCSNTVFAVLSGVSIDNNAYTYFWGRRFYIYDQFSGKLGLEDY